MKFLPQVLPISAFGDGGFRFGAMSHLGSLLVLPDGMRAWNVGDVLKPEDFVGIIAVKSQVDFVLLGTGTMMARPPRDMLAFFKTEGLNMDFMSTSSAVHSYNVMLAEGRRLAAAMVAVP